MFPEARPGSTSGVQAHPLAELLACPPETERMLNAAARCIDADVGAVVFRQSENCRGLYVMTSGQYLRRTVWLDARLTLGVVRAGDLVELAAALGAGTHSYTLTAQVAGSVLLLPIEALNRAFASFPPLRMRLLEELAREVSRGYEASCRNRAPRSRQGAFRVVSSPE
jgi:CRP-like cAMP-binding protein